MGRPACRVSYDVSVFSSLLAGVTEMVSLVSEGGGKPKIVSEEKGKEGKKKRAL